MNPVIALIIANIIWGAASPIFKYALYNIPPFTLAFIRFFFAALIFLPFAIREKKPITWKILFGIILASFLGISLNISFFFLGLEKTTSINAPIIASSGPVFLYLLSVYLLKEKPKMKTLLGMMVALIGVILIIFSPMIFEGKKMIWGEIEGNLLLVAATVASVLNTVVTKKIIGKTTLIQFTFIGFMFGALTFIPFIPHELGNWSFGLLDIRGIVGIIFGVFLSSAAGYYLYYYAINILKAQDVGIFTYIDPVVSVMIAVPLLSEYPNIFFILASLLVFMGIFLAESRIHWHPFVLIKHYELKIKNSLKEGLNLNHK